MQKLYVAEYDLTFFEEREYMVRHLRKSRLQHPPGDEIYRNGKVSMVRSNLHGTQALPRTLVTWRMSAGGGIVL